MTTRTSTLLIVCAVLLGAGLIVGQREMEKAQVRAVIAGREADRNLLQVIDLLVYACRKDDQDVDAEYLEDSLSTYGDIMDSWLKDNPPVTQKGQALAKLREGLGAATQTLQQDRQALSAIKARLLPEALAFQVITKDGLR